MPVLDVRTAIIEASLASRPQSREDFLRLKREVSGAYKSRIPSTAALRKTYDRVIAKAPTKRDDALDRLLCRRAVRSLSGVAVVTVLTKPFPCPGRCVYCPTETRMPKSYLSNEPAAARALASKFDPWHQVTVRLRAMTANGHPTDKIELIVKGGTWSAYTWEYRKWFIKRCFDAANAFGGKRAARTASLKGAQDANEQAGHRIIGITLETRPDWLTVDEIVRLRELGCTRIELGVQSVNDAILRKVRRGHDTSAVVRATRLLKESGYKTDYHMMPQLPGATPASDLRELREIFSNPDFRPDMLKIYPCVVLELAELHAWWKDGSYEPYPDRRLIEMLIEAKQAVPRYCRISRLIRDIPSTSIVAGNAVTNLRETIQRLMRERGLRCECLRCREIGHAAKDDPRLLSAKPVLFEERYEASGGTEVFLSFEDRARRAVFGFCRLRMPEGSGGVGKRESGKVTGDEVERLRERIPEIRGAAFIRELHTYGHLVPIAGRDASASQHKGLGSALMTRAERIARGAGFKKLAVISGIGVRDYYRKLGYRLQGTYMVKAL